VEVTLSALSFSHTAKDCRKVRFVDFGGYPGEKQRDEIGPETNKATNRSSPILEPCAFLSPSSHVGLPTPSTGGGGQRDGGSRTAVKRGLQRQRLRRDEAQAWRWSEGSIDGGSRPAADRGLKRRWLTRGAGARPPTTESHARRWRWVDKDGGRGNGGSRPAMERVLQRRRLTRGSGAGST
jgi:hypothetical protein